MGDDRLIQITPQLRILVAIEAINGRKGIDSLAQLCREKLKADPFSGCLFIFRSRSAKSMERDPSDERTGVFTSGIVSTASGRKIALYFTGRQHAGENLADVMKQRAPELSAPIQMCDALSRNTPKLSPGAEILLANCLAHYLDSGIIRSECLKGVERGEWLVGVVIILSGDRRPILHEGFSESD